MAKTKKKTARQLDADIAKATLLPADWPSVARDAVEKAAREYDRAIREQWAVPDVEMKTAIKEVYADLERLDNERDWYGGDPEAFDRDGTWYARYEAGRLDSEIRAAIGSWVKLAAPDVKFATPIGALIESECAMRIKYPSKKAIRDWIVKVMMDDPHLSVLVDLASSEHRRTAWVASFNSPEAIDQIDTPWGRMTRWFAAHTIVKDWSKVWPHAR